MAKDDKAKEETKAETKEGSGQQLLGAASAGVGGRRFQCITSVGRHSKGSFVTEKEFGPTADFEFIQAVGGIVEVGPEPVPSQPE